MEERRLVLTGDVGIGTGDRFRVLPGRQPALVLAFLVIERHRPIRREELADLLWPERIPPHWAGAVRGVLSKLRAFLAVDDPPVLTIRAVGGLLHVQLAPDTAVDLDLQLDPDGVAADIVFLPREDGEWVRAQRERLAVARRRALLARAASLIERGDPMAALVHLDTIVAANPFDEEAVREAMRANVASGRRAAALDVYDSLRRRLDDELGVRPTPLTEAAMLEALGEPPIAAPGTVALPVDAGSTFVGRSNHLDRLDAIAADAARGRLRMVLIEGESGVGKTRLLAEWSSRRPLAQVFWGRCTGAGVAFEPVVEALSRHFRAEPAALAELGPLGEPLSTLFPELLEPPPAPASLDPQQRRALLFRSITSAIAGPARDGGALWVVDDVQSADADTRDLLVHLAHGLSDEPVVLAMTLREPDAAVAGLLAELARRGFERMQLSGLSDLEVHSLLREAGMAGEEPDEISASVRSRTGGNPLYVRQLVEEAIGEGRPIDPTIVPAALRDLVTRRVEALGRGAGDVLSLAAIAGAAVDPAVLAECSARPADELQGILEALCRAGFLIATRRDRLVWAHGLVRDGVIEGLAPARAAALHLRIGLALEHRAPATAVASHFRQAGAPGAPAAVTHGLAAGRLALSQSAWSTAADEMAAVVALASDPAQRAEALVGRGNAERGRGNVEAARQSFEDALALARTHDLTRIVAESVLGLVGGGGRGVSGDRDDAARAALLDEAARALQAGDDNNLLVSVLCERALALVLTPGTESTRARLVEDAISLARSRESVDMLATALLGRRSVYVDARDVRSRLADTREVLAMPGDELRPEVRLAARVAAMEDLLLLGRRDEVGPLVDQAVDEAAAFDHPYWRWSVTTWRALIAIVDGDLERAEELAFAALSHQPTNVEAIAALGVELVDIRLLQGRAEEVLGLLVQAVADNPTIPAYRAVLALCAASAGDLDLARATFDRFAERDFMDLPADSNRFLALAVLADTGLRLGDTERTPRLRELLTPYSGLQVVLNCYGGGGAWWGPVDELLERLGGRQATTSARRGS